MIGTLKMIGTLNVIGTLKALAMTLLSIAALQWPATAAAQDWPTKPVHIVVPFPPGGGTDIITRALAARLQARLNTPFVIENLPGAGGILGTQKVARAAPDGHMLVIGITNTFAINPTFYKQLPYDPVRDFQPVSLLSVGPHVLVTSPETPAKNLDEFIDYVKKNPGRLSYASYGNGSTAHLITELLKKQKELDLNHVPYKGIPPALNDVMGRQVSMLVSSAAPAIPLIQGKRLRALAVMGDRRIGSIPDVPTMSELGFTDEMGFRDGSLTLWYGLFAPAGTPRPIVDRINAEFRAVLTDKELVEIFAKAGNFPSPMGVEQFVAFVKAESELWGKLVTLSGAKAD